MLAPSSAVSNVNAGVAAVATSSASAVLAPASDTNALLILTAVGAASAVVLWKRSREPQLSVRNSC